MVESAAGPTGRIFISYRRQETAYAAGWLFDRLEEECGAGQIFKDVDSIELGDDFVEMITRAVGSCDVLLALIGDRWLTVTDKNGRRRLDDPNDFVRLEIEAALKRNVRIIPILVDGASMPHPDELPTSVAGLARRQALELSPSRFDYDTGRLLKVLTSTLADVRTAQANAPAVSASAGNPPDQRIGRQQSGKQSEQAKQPRTPSIPPAADAAPAWDWPPADHMKPPDRQPRRVSTRAGVLIGVSAGMLILLLIVAGVVYYNPGRNLVTPTFSDVVLQDDFASRANGWDDAGGTGAGGHYYKNRTYRIKAETEPGGEGSTKASAPRKAKKVYPSAGPNLGIEVDAKTLAAIPEGTAYGVGCRMGKNRDGWYGYLFTLGNDYVNISKYDVDHNYRQLSPKKGTPLPSAFNVNGTNRLEAACFSDDGDKDVHLVFKVNGQVAAQETDSKDPLTAGTVALLAEAYKESTEAVEVEFDNFVVRTTQRNRGDQQPGQKSSPRQASTEQPGPTSAPPLTPSQLPLGPDTTDTVTDTPGPSATE